MSRRPDVARLLGRALESDSCRAGCDAAIETSDTIGWASATFYGARHRLTLTAPSSDALDRWVEGLPDVELSLRGHVLADLEITRVRRQPLTTTIEIAALTVED